MAETMYEAPGIGLAATQVDFHQRIIIIDISEDKNNLIGYDKSNFTRKKRREKLTKKVAYLFQRFLKR